MHSTTQPWNSAHTAFLRSGKTMKMMWPAVLWRLQGHWNYSCFSKYFINPSSSAFWASSCVYRRQTIATESMKVQRCDSSIYLRTHRAALISRMCRSSSIHSRRKGGLTSYCQVVHDFLVMYATSNISTEADIKIDNFRLLASQNIVAYA